MKKQLFKQLLMAFCMISIFAFQAYAQPRGYEPPSAISDDDTYRCSNYFKQIHGENGIPISGGVITREALDQILKTSNCNAITYKFCMDSTGRIGTPNTIFLVLSGANVTLNNGVITVNEINAPRYNSNDWCPPSCMKLRITEPGGTIKQVE